MNTEYAKTGNRLFSSTAAEKVEDSLRLNLRDVGQSIGYHHIITLILIFFQEARIKF